MDTHATASSSDVDAHRCVFCKASFAIRSDRRGRSTQVRGLESMTRFSMIDKKKAIPTPATQGEDDPEAYDGYVMVRHRNEKKTGGQAGPSSPTYGWFRCFRGPPRLRLP